MDPRAKRFADSLHFDLISWLWAIPTLIAAAVITAITDISFGNVTYIFLGAAVLFAGLRSLVGWARREFRRTH